MHLLWLSMAISSSINAVINSMHLLWLSMAISSSINAVINSIHLLWQSIAVSFNINVVVVVALLFYVHGKHLRTCRDGQLT